MTRVRRNAFACFANLMCDVLHFSFLVGLSFVGNAPEAQHCAGGRVLCTPTYAVEARGCDNSGTLRLVAMSLAAQNKSQRTGDRKSRAPPTPFPTAWQSFKWSERAKKLLDKIESAGQPLRRAMTTASSVDVYDVFFATDGQSLATGEETRSVPKQTPCTLFAAWSWFLRTWLRSYSSTLTPTLATTDLLRLDKTSSPAQRANVVGKVHGVLIGKVPDRGGRPKESRPPPEMPGFRKRTVGAAKPQRERGGGRGGGRGHGGKRGGRGQGGALLHRSFAFCACPNFLHFRPLPVPSSSPPPPGKSRLTHPPLHHSRRRQGQG